eukprot:gene11437-12449_t
MPRRTTRRTAARENLESSSRKRRRRAPPDWFSSYQGQRTQDGVPHGRGSYTIEEEETGATVTTFTGKFVNGRRHGAGTMTFADESTLSGVWDDDELEGASKYHCPSAGLQIEHTYLKGRVFGKGVERALPDLQVIYEGWHRDGMRSTGAAGGQVGRATFWSDDDSFEGGFKGVVDGVLEGSWKDNVCNGWARWLYPDGSALEGLWKDGMMEAAVYVPEAEDSFSAARARARARAPWSCKYKYDRPTATEPSSQPMLPDPYESKWSYVKLSNIPTCPSDGLFAMQDIPAGQICACPAEGEGGVDDRDSWDLNDNVMSLVPGLLSIDVPKAYASASHYCASLGHKANHAHPVHPRFGAIKCVRAITAIKKDDEILVDYGYMDEDAPPWWIPKA